MAATFLLAIRRGHPLKSLCYLGLASVGCGAPLSVSGQQALSLARHQLTDRIDVFSGFANGNVLAIRTDSGTLLIDAQSARRVGLLDSALSSLGAGPVKLVINTHYHGDHIEGNAHFRAKGARILAHKNVSVQAGKDTTIVSWDNWHRTPAALEALPTMTFSDSSVLRFGGEEVRIYHAPNAHTDGDAIVWLRRSNIIHLGDIFELAAPPFIDWWAGGSAAGMIAAIDRVLPWINERTRVVPGHGPVSDRATLLSYRAMLATLQTRVQAFTKAGKSLDEILAAKPAAEFEDRLGGARYGDRLTKLLYAGLGPAAVALPPR
jgi:glyoxylase-like metal-dependent hydrolase (beta-lactamase superfamily II)